VCLSLQVGQFVDSCFPFYRVDTLYVHLFNACCSTIIFDTIINVATSYYVGVCIQYITHCVIYIYLTIYYIFIGSFLYMYIPYIQYPAMKSEDYTRFMVKIQIDQLNQFL